MADAIDPSLTLASAGFRALGGAADLTRPRGPSRRCSGELAVAPCLVHQRRTHVRILVDDLAVEAIEAFVHVDCPARLDGLYRAAPCAQLAGAAAFRAALQRREPAQPAANRHHRAKRAEEPAKRPFDEQAGGEKHQRA